MVATIPDLWPDSVKNSVCTPQAILRTQASLLEQRTGGLLHAEVNFSVLKDFARATFDIVAPALGHRSERVLEIESERGQIYPVKVFASLFNLDPSEELASPLPFRLHHEADGVHYLLALTDEAFIEAVRVVFSSPQVVARLQSIIAESNEIQEKRNLAHEKTNGRAAPPAEQSEEEE